MPGSFIEAHRFLEKIFSWPGALHAGLVQVILGSTSSRASRESAGPRTGEYRFVLTGRLDLQGSRQHR